MTVPEHQWRDSRFMPKALEGDGKLSELGNI